MLNLVTGHPGAGKTLYTLTYVKDLAEREKRQVYYSGIGDLRLPWIELKDGEDWHNAPAGSIIVIDEAQRIFRMRAVGSQVPAHVSALETHRHRGLDLFVITQHPMLLDTNVRRLVGRHFHVMRKFGMERATVHEWSGLQESPDKSREDSIRHEWAYPPEMFALYKSAESHTVRRRIPARVWFLLAVPVLLIALGWMAYRTMAGYLTGDKLKEGIGASAPAGASPAGLHVGPSGSGKGPQTAAEYVAAYDPRVSGLSYTAPAYDAITQPVHAPYPAACLHLAESCKCFTQQGTALDVPRDLCRQIVDKGFFLAWEPKTPALQTNQRPNGEGGSRRHAEPNPQGAPADPARAHVVAAGRPI